MHARLRQLATKISSLLSETQAPFSATKAISSLISGK